MRALYNIPSQIKGFQDIITEVEKEGYQDISEAISIEVKPASNWIPYLIGASLLVIITLYVSRNVTKKIPP